VELVDAADGGFDLRIDIGALNPNDVALRGVAADWALSVDDVVHARGRVDLDLTLPARGRAEAALVAHLKPGAAARIRTNRTAPDGGDSEIAPTPAPLGVDGVLHWQSSSGDTATPFAWDEAAAALNRVRPEPPAVSQSVCATQ
jgi:hypothetical protein